LTVPGRGRSCQRITAIPNSTKIPVQPENDQMVVVQKFQFSEIPLVSQNNGAAGHDKLMPYDI
jgi:hypothetical protein